MGYMGFGMVRKVYTRKPRKAFKKLREAYGEEIKNYRIEIQNNKIEPLTPQERLVIKDRLKKRNRLESIRQAKIWGLSLLLLLFFGFLFVQVFMWFFG